jgi:endonuclease YncB( thermonuclease family)
MPRTRILPAVTAFAAAGLLLQAVPAVGADPALPGCPAFGAYELRPAGALTGDSFRNLDGNEFRLSGILAPLAGQAAEISREALDRKLASQPLRYGVIERVRDRYGRVQALVYAGDEWVQGALLREGHVLATPDNGTARCARELLAAEAEARNAGAGLWRNGMFKVLSLDELMREARARAGTFQIVEGRVTTASVVRGRAYVNFGTDYAADFTVTVAPLDMMGFRRARFDPRTLAGRTIRVRGWLEIYNGPNMQIASPYAIEVLGE